MTRVMNDSLVYSLIFGIFGFIVGAVAISIHLSAKHRVALGQKDAELAILQNNLQSQLQSMEKQQNNLTTINQQLQDRFENLAQKIFEEKTQKFTDQNLKGLSTLIEPFREKLKDFERKVDESYSTERAERGALKGELNKLLELNLRMSSEAENLSRALKGDNKSMGTWGEMILENILEKSGLRKNEEYLTQETYKNDEGQAIRPDVIVKIPDGHHLIIDSKVSLTAYEQYVNANDEKSKETFAKAHMESLKRHIDGLSAKKYSTAQGLSAPEFVFLFMPIEPAFALAFKLNPELLQQAWDKQIALVSPTTLLTTLRTVAATWKYDRQEKNSLEIARQAGALYDKFVGFVEDLQDLGKKLEQTQKVHSQVMNKLTEGSGNIVRKVETLKELGAKTEKKLSLPQG